MSITHNLTDQELNTVLHALRVLQETRDPKRAYLGCKASENPYSTTTACDHAEEAPLLTTDEIDNLCERLNLGPEKPQRRVVVIVEHGVAEFSEVPDGIEAVLIDYDDLDCYQGEALKNAISALPEDLQPALREYFTVEDDEPEGQDDPAHDSEPPDEPEQ